MEPSTEPTMTPTMNPSVSPSVAPTVTPSQDPTYGPTGAPSTSPSPGPTAAPTLIPTPKPTELPSGSPSVNPSANPTQGPTNRPTVTPTVTPSQGPTYGPTDAPTLIPTPKPTQAPSASPAEISMDIISPIEQVGDAHNLLDFSNWKLIVCGAALLCFVAALCILVRNVRKPSKVKNDLDSIMKTAPSHEGAIRVVSGDEVLNNYLDVQFKRSPQNSPMSSPSSDYLQAAWGEKFSVDNAGAVWYRGTRGPSAINKRMPEDFGVGELSNDFLPLDSNELYEATLANIVASMEHEIWMSDAEDFVSRHVLREQISRELFSDEEEGRTETTTFHH